MTDSKMPCDETNDPLIGAVVRELRQPLDLGPAVDARVLAELRRAPGRAPGRQPRREPGVWRWLRRPRTIALSPLGGLAVAAGLVGLTLVGADLVRVTPTASPTASPAASPMAAAAPPAQTMVAAAASGAHVVQFVLRAPASSQVAVVGDFNDWNPAATPLARTAEDGVWSITVPLAPGRYRYTFVVDGKRWVPDPSEPPALGDDFGTPTSVITVARS